MKSLADLTGGRYKIILDESWYVERPGVQVPDRVWYERITCQGGGFISIFCNAELPCPLWAAGCPLRRSDCREHGDLILKLWTPRPKNARLLWEKIEGNASCYLHPMDGEAELYFPARLLPLVAKMAGARKKRRLSPEHRAKLVAAGMKAGRATRFKTKSTGTQGRKKAQI
jgi:hypothetical protein